MANGAILEELDKAQKSAKTAREKAKRAGEKIVNKAMIMGGGAAAGGIDGKYPDKKFMGVRAPMLAGAALSVVGLMNAAGRYSDAVGSLGDGMLAYEIGNLVKTKVKPASSTTSGVDFVGAGHNAGQMGQSNRPITAEELEATLMNLRR